MKGKLLDQVRAVIRAPRYSYRTEQSYSHWIRRFILFHNKRHPKDMRAAKIERFLSWLATERGAPSATQNQALFAILFLYREVLELELPWLDNITPARRPKRLPVVLTIDEVRRVFNCLDGAHWLVGALLYGTGLRISETASARERRGFRLHTISMRDGKGQKDRRHHAHPTGFNARSGARLPKPRSRNMPVRTPCTCIRSLPIC